MPFYHLEPILNFTHVLKGYTDLNSMVSVQLLHDNQPADCSGATSVLISSGDYTVADESMDLSDMADGVLRFSCAGLPAGGRRMHVAVKFEDQIIAFGQITVFVMDTTRSDDIAVFSQYPDTEEELEEWENAGNSDDGVENNGNTEGNSLPGFGSSES